MTSATDELRRMLDERGVRHFDGDAMTCWGFEDEFTFRYSADEVEGGIRVTMWVVTPEQAVEATLGRGTCHIMTCDNLNELGGDVWLECDACHWQMPLEPSTPRFSFCPNCGRRVV